MELENYSKLKRVHLGGTGVMYTLESANKHWIYKPAVRKNSDYSEPFRGIVQECAYQIQNIVDPKSAIVCKYVVSNDLHGSVQELIPVKEDARDYHEMQNDDDSVFTQDEVNQFMREFVTDYLLCNFDSHGRNFITDKDGIIRGVDKEQSFRYINEPESKKPSITYSPNSERYGETEPIYNTLFRRYSEGNLDIDFSVINLYMNRVASVDEVSYRKIFEPYCDACSKAFGTDADRMLDTIVDRKNNMYTNIKEFFDELTEIRKNNLEGKKGK